MLFIIQTQTSHGFDILHCEGSKEETDVCDLLCHFMSTKDLTLDYPGLLGLGNVCHPPRKNCISIICSTVFSQKPDEALCIRVSKMGDTGRGCLGLTEKEGILSEFGRSCSLNHTFIKQLKKEYMKYGT